MNPQARTEGLVIEELPQETLVYDTQRHKAHCLNEAAALVWKSCDGRTSARAIAQRLGRELGLSVDEVYVLHALDRLQKADLLNGRLELPALPSRRQLLRRLGVAAGVAAVATIAAPHAWAQTTTCPIIGDACQGQAECTPCKSGQGPGGCDKVCHESQPGHMTCSGQPSTC